MGGGGEREETVSCQTCVRRRHQKEKEEEETDEHYSYDRAKERGAGEKRPHMPPQPPRFSGTVAGSYNKEEEGEGAGPPRRRLTFP